MISQAYPLLSSDSLMEAPEIAAHGDVAAGSSSGKKARRAQAIKSDRPLACPLYKHDPGRYGGPGGCADWTTLEIHRLFSI
jgi:hypothetical protein